MLDSTPTSPTDVTLRQSVGSPARRPAGLSRNSRHTEKKIKEATYLAGLEIQQGTYFDVLQAEGDRIVASTVIAGVVAIAQEEEWAAEQVRTQRAQERIEAVADAHALLGIRRVQCRGQRR